MPEEDFLGDAPPPTSPVLVAAAVVLEAGRFLVGRRPAEKRHGGRWEFPGGKVRPGETVSAALGRELHEELGVHVQTLERTLFETMDPGSPYLIRFVETRVRGTPSAREHSELAWCDANDLDRLDLAPADRRFVDALLGPDPLPPPE